MNQVDRDENTGEGDRFIEMGVDRSNGYNGPNGRGPTEWQLERSLLVLTFRQWQGDIVEVD
jgi:hypothetical protein